MPDYALMNQFLYEGKAKEVEQLTRDALAEGRPVEEVLAEGLIAGMSVVGEDFKHNVLYVPEVLIAARAMKAGMAVLKPLLAAGGESSGSVGTLLMGTVRGDLHDIGKNLVCMMAEGAGFKVVDIGVDQSFEKFLAASEQCKPDIVGMSALLTTTMTYMKTVIDGYRGRGETHIKFAIGGAPISQMFADEIGADGYGQDASSAVDLFLRFVGKGDEVAATPVAAVATKPVRPPGHKSEKSSFQILYWKDLPAELKVWDDFDELKVALPNRFAERIDATAQKLGLTSADAYTAELRWGDEQERVGSIDEVAAAVRQELEAALR